ncbi:MAG: hypothetical protein WC178_00955 [Candidatus Paceibacterota bacterium]
MQEKENIINILIRRAIIFKNFLFSGIKIAGFKPYWRNKEITRVLFLSMIINLIMWLYLFHNRIESDYPIILHYNLFFGVDALGSYEKIFLLPLAGAILFFLNATLGQFFYRTERLASYILTMNIFIIQIILMLSCHFIIRVNG